ncbi:YsnF/AvaK domain-containing protein [Psychrobacter immobilis]|uniref:YsnF/AvaK domain-containing protein n=2 Tax=Psychrobacter TaxID=497 RepID=UPI003FCF6076
MMTTNYDDSIQNDSFLQKGLHNKQVTPNAITAPIDSNNGTVDYDIESNDISSNDIDKSNHNVGHLELLEERPVINKERLDVGKVTVTKHARTKTIDVPIELVEEYITIRTEYHDAKSQDLLSGNYDEKDILRHVEPSLDSKAVVTVNGKQIEIGDEPIEIVLSRQVATITKDTYAIQEIDINKTTHTHTDSIQVVLKHEELDVKEEGFLAHESSANPHK